MSLLLLLGGLALTPAVTQAQPTAQSVAATLTLAPTTVIPNQTLVVTGENFTWGSGVTIDSLTVDGGELPPSKISSGARVTVDSGGTFIAMIVVPINSNTLNPGTHTLQAVDSLGRVASASFTVAAPTISITPTSSSVGSTITVTGGGFPATSGRIGADPTPLVDIEYEVTGGIARKLLTVQPDTAGAFTVIFEVPLKTPVPSTNNLVRASIPNTGFVVTANHTVPESEFQVAPATGAPGTQVTVTGNSYRAFVPVSSVVMGGIPVLTDQTIYTDGDGDLSLSFTVPMLENGTVAVSVAVGDSSRVTTFVITDGLTGEPETVADGPVSGPPPPQWTPQRHSVSASLIPLGKNLIRVFHFDNATKGWSFYDPKPEFAPANTLGELVQQQGYWVQVKWDETIWLGEKPRELYRGWNLIAW